MLEAIEALVAPVPGILQADRDLVVDRVAAVAIDSAPPGVVVVEVVGDGGTELQGGGAVRIQDIVQAEAQFDELVVIEGRARILPVLVVEVDGQVGDAAELVSANGVIVSEDIVHLFRAIFAVVGVGTTAFRTIDVGHVERSPEVRIEATQTNPGINGGDGVGVDDLALGGDECNCAECEKLFKEDK